MEQQREEKRKNRRVLDMHECKIRTDCYQRLRDVFQQRMERYYTNHPDRIGDQRGRDNQDLVILILRDTLNVLDEYKIDNL